VISTTGNLAAAVIVAVVFKTRHILPLKPITSGYSDITQDIVMLDEPLLHYETLFCGRILVSSS